MKPTAASVAGYFFGGAMVGCFVGFWAANFFGPVALPAGVLVGCVLGVFAGIVQARREQQYQEELTGLAEVTGFGHAPQLDRKELGPLLRLPIFKSASAVRHRLVRHDDALPMGMIDVSHLEGGGRHQRTVWRTVVVFPGGAAGLPDLWLRPLTAITRPMFFPQGGVLFDPPPGEEDAGFVAFFTMHYLLVPLDIPPAEEEERALAEGIRRVFSLEVLRHFVENLNWEVQVHGGDLALWHGKKPCPAPRPGRWWAARSSASSWAA
jgi:hypothetical protein